MREGAGRREIAISFTLANFFSVFERKSETQFSTVSGLVKRSQSP
jgi:hypothetical protein